ncbi:MAG: hypothetical protein JNL89_00170 [Rhodanobacteraceae bacterium]|nr:hypothetical protein [Rhodanobacteraceae bacterium]
MTFASLSKRAAPLPPMAKKWGPGTRFQDFDRVPGVIGRRIALGLV